MLSSERALELAADGTRVVLVAAETNPADVPGMLAAAAVLTATGGIASHAAVVARGAGKPAVCGAEGLRVDRAAATVRFGERVLHEGDPVSLDGRTGAVYAGTLSVSVAGPPPELSTLLEWADSARRLGVRVNADTAPVETALALGAEGVGLCRTEHQFLGERLPLIRRVLLAADPAARDEALVGLERAQHDAAQCVHLHGGMGFTWEHDAHLYFRRAQSDAVLLGGAAHHRERLAGLLGW
ncbi:PEP-utilizing enzyme [Streptomyces shaanxiensis]